MTQTNSHPNHAFPPSAYPLAQKLELLSPARTVDIGFEAVKHGADAVYIGGPGFGARKDASNSEREIAALTAYAHRFHARVFVTMNTILRDDELETARQQIYSLYEAGVDALIIQDMGLLELDLPPIELHASTQCDIRTPEKAVFLQDAGFTQLVLARELNLAQISAISLALDSAYLESASPQRAAIEFFVHGALCVAYSGQCFISHAHTGRSANRGECSQACRLPYTIEDTSGRIVAHDKHVLSLKDNNQSTNLSALIEAGVRSFKIEGRYKDMAYVKNITAHYRRLLDTILEDKYQYKPASSGKCVFTFAPQPEQNFNRQVSDYFVNGRSADIGAFDSPKHSGIPIGWISRIHPQSESIEVCVDKPLSNGDGFSYFDLQGELIGFAANRVELLDDYDAAVQRWRIFPNESLANFPDLHPGRTLERPLSRNRDMNWIRLMQARSSERHIALDAFLSETPSGFALTLLDVDGFSGTAEVALKKEPARLGLTQTNEQLSAQLHKLGNTDFVLQAAHIQFEQAWFIPASQLNALRRAALDDLAQTRLQAFVDAQRLHVGQPKLPAAPYPELDLSYLANVYNQKATAFYRKHGVRRIDPAFESNQERGDVSLMITKHCVRFSLSLCPKQAKGVTGVQGTVRAEPLTLVNGKERLTLRFDCKPCEMHVVGKIKTRVLNSTPAQPILFYPSTRT